MFHHFLDSGETSLCLARLIAQLSGYTIITASIPVINVCMGSQNQVIICGGVLAPQVQASAGTFAADFLNQLNMDAAFLRAKASRPAVDQPVVIWITVRFKRLLSKTPDSVSFWPRAAKPVILL